MLQLTAQAGDSKKKVDTFVSPRNGIGAPPYPRPTDDLDGSEELGAARPAAVARASQA